MEIVKSNQSNQLFNKIFKRTKIYRIDDKIDLTQEKIGIELGEYHNLLKSATLNQDSANLLRKLNDNGYILYWYKNRISYFVKNDKMNTIWQRNDLLQLGNFLFTINEPENLGESEDNSLIVVFSSYPNTRADALSSKITRRVFPDFFSNIDSYIIGSTIVLRIMDSCSLYGSAYMNTKTNTEIETNVQNIISEVKEKYGIQSNKVILTGSHKGAVAALYHSYLGNYVSVVCDPQSEFETQGNEDLAALIDFMPKINVEEKFEDFRKQENKVIVNSATPCMDLDGTVKNLVDSIILPYEYNNDDGNFNLNLRVGLSVIMNQWLLKDICMSNND